MKKYDIVEINLVQKFNSKRDYIFTSDDIDMFKQIKVEDLYAVAYRKLQRINPSKALVLHANPTSTNTVIGLVEVVQLTYFFGIKNVFIVYDNKVIEEVTLR